MFNKKYTIVVPNDGEYRVQSSVFSYVCELRRELMKMQSEKSDLEFKVYKYEKELKAIKPVVANINYEPPVSKDCEKCKFVARSEFSGDIIGCRKNMVCSDFAKED